jgi:hypothetical protein
VPVRHYAAKRRRTALANPTPDRSRFLNRLAHNLIGGCDFLLKLEWVVRAWPNHLGLAVLELHNEETNIFLVVDRLLVESPYTDRFGVTVNRTPRRQ